MSFHKPQETLVHFKLKKYQGNVVKGKFGTEGAKATAFVSGFQPRSGTIQEIWRQQQPEVQIFSVATTYPQINKLVNENFFVII